MARPLRIEYEGAFYHVSSRGNEQKDIYQLPSDYERFKGYVHEAQQKYGFLLHGYVLMPNHFHLVVETPQANLSQLMHYISGSYTTYFNRRAKRSGHLFQGRYKAILIEHDRYLLELSRYVHLNPVRAGLTQLPEDYPYSSYSSYVSPEAERIVNRDLIWSMVSRDEDAAARRYRDFVNDALGLPAQNPLRKVYAGAILGSDAFIRESLKRMEGADLDRKDIAHRKALHRSHGVDDIMAAVALHCSVTGEDIMQKKGLYRNMAIYLTKKHTGLTNRQIGEIFGNIGYSGVSRVHERFGERLSKDRALADAVDRIEASLSNVKG